MESSHMEGLEEGGVQASSDANQASSTRSEAEAPPSTSGAPAEPSSLETESENELKETGASDEERLAEAEKLKLLGNQCFGQGDYDAARRHYDQALDIAPATSKTRAVCFCNMAACDLKQKQYDVAVQNATHALGIDPQYVKALMRRSDAFEALDDLDHALQDANAVLELDPSNAWAVKATTRLRPVVAERHEKLKDEMLSKLKELGNSILGNFGMSLDNFKAIKDPSTGSYSISFQQ